MCKGPSPDLDTAKGIIYGVIVGCSLWAAIIIATYYIIKWGF